MPSQAERIAAAIYALPAGYSQRDALEAIRALKICNHNGRPINPLAAYKHITTTKKWNLPFVASVRDDVKLMLQPEGTVAKLPARKIVPRNASESLKITLTREAVQNAIDARKDWHLGDGVLYRLCAEHPGHGGDDVILAKIWLIGRAYSVAIERRRVVGEYKGDAFFRKLVAPRIRESSIDFWFQEIRNRPDDKLLVLHVHQKLTRLFESITGINNRSLASKYLHFHFPLRCYIFDRFSATVAKNTVVLDSEIYNDDVDIDYAGFFYRCELIKEYASKLIGRTLTPKEVDAVLLELSPKNSEGRTI